MSNNVSLHADPLGSEFFRIRAESNIRRYGVKKGDWGGLVSASENVGEGGWVSRESRVLEDAVTYGLVHSGALVFGQAMVSGTVRAGAVVYGSSDIAKRAEVSGAVELGGNSRVRGIMRLHASNLTLNNAAIHTPEDFTSSLFHCVSFDDDDGSVSTLHLQLAVYNTSSGFKLTDGAGNEWDWEQGVLQIEAGDFEFLGLTVPEYESVRMELEAWALLVSIRVNRRRRGGGW